MRLQPCVALPRVDPPPLSDPMRKLAVLVIESEPDIRQMVSAVLARDGYAVLEVSRGQDGLRELHHQHPDLVVLDEALSDLSGWEVLARIRDTSDLPVLLLTTPATDNDRLANLDASNEDYLVKPFARAWLPDKLRALRMQHGSG
jgi:two-component system, OmpR family, KDP operon response regulator KdpE